MIKPKYIDLMNQELDGANTPAQSRELEDYLEGNQEARTYYRELAQALGVFAEAEMLTPPADLAERILARVDRPSAAHPTHRPDEDRPGLLAAFRELFSWRLRPAFATTFALGAVFGLMLFAGSNWLSDRHGTAIYDEVRGTANPVAWDLEKVSEGELILPGIAGFYRTQREGQDLRLRLNLRSEAPAVIKFSHGPGTTLQHYNSHNPVTANLQISELLVELNHRGRGSYDLVFHGDTQDPKPIKMLVFSEGRLVKTQMLENPDR
jgi:hypothetical protein